MRQEEEASRCQDKERKEDGGRRGEGDGEEEREEALIGLFVLFVWFFF